MTILGIDFDNTIVKYDRLFHNLAVEYGYVNKELEKRKVIVRDTMNKKGLKKEFTCLQGEVYGNKIMDAEIAENLLNALEQIYSAGVKLVIVSHKTKYPIEGQKYDLHKAAKEWLRENKIINNRKIGIEERDIYFAATKEEKIKIIEALKCDYFVDDLVDILKKISSKCKKFHYSETKNEANIYNTSNWLDIAKLIIAEES